MFRNKYKKIADFYSFRNMFQNQIKKKHTD